MRRTLPSLFACAVIAGTSASAPAQVVHHHHHLLTAVAGVAAYEIAKHRHHGLIHRHPLLTGAAAAWAVHHHFKHK